MRGDVIWFILLHDDVYLSLHRYVIRDFRYFHSVMRCDFRDVELGGGVC